MPKKNIKHESCITMEYENRDKGHRVNGRRSNGHGVNGHRENTNWENHGKPSKVRRSAFVENGNQRFLILDAPTDDNINSYIEVLQKKNVSIVVRACESTYSPQPIKEAGIRFMDLPFGDGEPPPDEVLDQWLPLLSAEFGKNKTTTVGVHCVAGLGRAPILVAIALVESGKDACDAIDMIRKVRKGAFNAKQLAWIGKYKRRGGSGCRPVCAIC